MPYFMVFQIEDRARSAPPGVPVDLSLKTFAVPLAAFHADTAEEACQAAAAKTKRLTSYFAIEGTPWGIDMLQVEGATEIGATPDDEELAETAKERRLRELERRVLDRDVPLD